MTAVSFPNALDGSSRLVALFDELRGSQQETERFLDTLFDQLSDCLVRLNQRSSEIETTRKELEQAQGAAEINALARCTELEAQLETIRTEAAEARAAEQQAIADLIAERDEYQRQLRELPRNPDGAAAYADADKLEAHCAVLEEELESVRGRASELSESLEQSERKLEAERSEWTQQLKQMRQAIESQPPVAVKEEPAATAPATAKPACRGADPNQVVVGSVMAQFEKLRSQRAKRRAERT